MRKLYKYSLFLLVIFSLLFLTGGGNQEVPVSEQELIPSPSGILVELHGGTISAESEGSGSTFRILIPLSISKL